MCRADGDLTLTTTELALLRYLAQRRGRDVARDELHAEVWGHGPQVLSRALDTTVRRLRKKLEVDPRQPRHLLTVHGVGYRLVVSEIEHAEQAMALVGELDAASSRSVPRAWIDAVDLLRQSLRELLGVGRVDDAARVGLALVRVLRRVGPYDEAAPVVEQLIDAGADPSWLVLLQLELLRVTSDASCLEAARALGVDEPAVRCRLAMAEGEEGLRRAVEMSSEMPFLRGQAAGRLATYLHRISPEESQRWFVHALDLTQQDGDLWEEAIVSGNFAGLLRSLGELEMAERYYLRTVERLEQHGDDWNRQVVLANLGTLRFQRFELDGAAAALQESRRLARALGRTVGVAVCTIDLSALSLIRGADADVLELEEAMGVVRRAGNRHYVSIALDNLGWCWLLRGQFGLARTFIERAIVVAEELGNPLLLAEIHTHLAEVLWEEGDRHGAWTLMEASAAVLQASPVRQPPALAARLHQARWAAEIGEAVPEVALRGIVGAMPASAVPFFEGAAAYRYRGAGSS